MITIKTEYWTHKPKLIPSYVFEPFLEVIREYCDFRSARKRKSCFFDSICHSDHSDQSDHDRSDNNSGYSSIPSYEWSDAPSILIEICKLVEQYTKEKYDYVLIHIYMSGLAGINWHNDFEALNSSVASISLGATRKFRLKKIGRKTGWDTEIYLNDGDLIWMHGPDPVTGRLSCQNIYLHTVPIEKKVKEPRINLTFRQYDNK